MRRTDHDGHVARQGPPPFRVLADTTYLSPMLPAAAAPPPPPRAPEPYKVAPSSTSYGRAHRRSSFVILAESSPASPESENASSTLPNTGRVSPFRGRGFKGPPPRSMSRPQSPEVTGNGRRRGRVERRGRLENLLRRRKFSESTKDISRTDLNISQIFFTIQIRKNAWVIYFILHNAQSELMIEIAQSKRDSSYFLFRSLSIAAEQSQKKLDTAADLPSAIHLLDEGHRTLTVAKDKSPS